MMPYGASKPGCDMLGNLQTLFLDTQEGHWLPFFWYCTGEPAGDGALPTTSVLCSPSCTVLAVPGTAHTALMKTRDWSTEAAESCEEWQKAMISCGFQGLQHQLTPHKSLHEHSWTSAQFRVFYFQDGLKVCMVRYSSSADRSHSLSHRSSSTL